MFEHVTILLSFVFAIALTHILTSTTELVWARRRVRISWLQLLWMLSAVISIVVNWIAIGPLASIKNWTPLEIVIQFVAAIVQYYTCSLISIRPERDGVVDMPAFYEQERPSIFAAYSLLMLVGIFQNFWDAKNYGMTQSQMFAAIGTVLLMLVATITAGWARPRWAQWAAAIGMLLLQGYFLVQYMLIS
ncbi:MAG TPA: hypothetical protein VLV55_12870 [Rhizomicrobium sp.]|nr:hypothetical protein [Rhizomicrobium sp.]